MSRHTSFRIGGPARLMALPKSAAQAKAAVLAAREADIVRPSSWATAPTCWCPTRGWSAFSSSPPGGTPPTR